MRFAWLVFVSRQTLFLHFILACVIVLTLFGIAKDINMLYPHHIDDIAYASHVDEVFPEILGVISVFAVVTTVLDHDHEAFMPMPAMAGRIRVGLSVLVIEFLLMLIVLSIIMVLRVLVPMTVRISYQPSIAVYQSLWAMTIDGFMAGLLMMLSTSRTTRGLTYVWGLFFVMVNLNAITLPQFAAYIMPVSKSVISNYHNSHWYQVSYLCLLSFLYLIKCAKKTIK